MRNRVLTFALCLTVFLAAQVFRAEATTFTLSDTERGWINQTGLSSPVSAGSNYIAGFCFSCTFQAEYRDFLQFTIPTLDGPITSAVLTLSTGVVIAAASPSMTYQITSLPATFGFNDLGAGTMYGSRVYTVADEFTNQSITLDAAAISAILSGTTFGIGGRITTLSSTTEDEYIFGNTGPVVCDTCIAELQLITSPSAVPEPASAVLLIAGTSLALVVRRFRRTR